jgi:hypothetical protein
VLTDIPQSVVGDFVGLALKVKDAGITSIVFDDTVIRPAYPDFDLIRQHVQDAISGPPAPAATDTDSGSGAGSGTAAPAPSGESSSGSTDEASDGGSAAATDSPAVDVADACAYDAVMAQEAMDEGEPPTRRR